MAITVSQTTTTGGKPSTPLFVTEVNVLCDNAYPAGGWPLSLADYLPSGSTVIGAFADDHLGLSGYQFHYDRANDKLYVFECAAAGNPMQELATVTALNGVNVRLIVLAY